VRLTNAGLEQTLPWEQAGIRLPQFDRAAMLRATGASPRWVHFGVGNLFRACIAPLVQELLEGGAETTGVIAVVPHGGEVIDRIFKPCDDLCLAVTLKADGSMEKRVVASIAGSLCTDRAGDFDRLRSIFRAPSLELASFTITEKGYGLESPGGGFLPAVEADFARGPGEPKSFLAKLAALCYERYRAGKQALALVSLDNCSHNGDKLREVIGCFAEKWVLGGSAEEGFLDYVRNPRSLSFPWTMIDKITPGPDAGVGENLKALGFEDTQVLLSPMGSRIAPFVNAEESQYLVIEDAFPAGRPALERAGVWFTDRQTVERAEKMKVSACLNPLHTALAIFGCLLGYTRISDEMRDPALVRLAEGIGYREGLPVVPDPGILSPKQFIDQVLQVRFPNPFLPDTPQRIASDTSKKIPIRFGETIKAYCAGPLRKAGELRFIPLVLAAWLRYLLGLDDQGRPFTLSPDPMNESLVRRLSGISLGGTGSFHEALEPILSDGTIFGVNLYEAGLGERVEGYFAELVAGPRAVRETLERHLAEVML
jgi:fructuronate reductase